MVWPHAQGKLEEAEPYMKQALAILKTVHGNEHSQVAIGLNNLGWLLIDQVRDETRCFLERREMISGDSLLVLVGW